MLRYFVVVAVLMFRKLFTIFIFDLSWSVIEPKLGSNFVFTFFSC